MAQIKTIGQICNFIKNTNRREYRITKAIANSHGQYKAMKDDVITCGIVFGSSLQIWFFIFVSTCGSHR